MEIPPNSGNLQLLDVHGAGAQRSDPKSGDPGEWPYGHGPQGDVIRIYNYARKKVGLWTIWYENGQKWLVINYKDGKEDSQH
jgi:hypothetical protein